MNEQTYKELSEAFDKATTEMVSTKATNVRLQICKSGEDTGNLELTPERKELLEKNKGKALIAISWDPEGDGDKTKYVAWNIPFIKD